MTIRSTSCSIQTIRSQMKLINNRHYKFSVHLSYDVQKHRITGVHGIVARWGSRGDIVDNPPGDQTGSVNLRTEEPLVEVFMNGKVRVLGITESG